MHRQTCELSGGSVRAPQFMVFPTRGHYLELEPKMTDKSKEIELLIDKAAKAEKSEDALRFSQAACNAANAMCSVKAAVSPSI